MTETKIKFSSRDGASFVKEVKAEVNQYFIDNGISRHANTAMRFKTAAIMLMFFAPYILIMWGGLSLMQMWFLTVIMGIGAAGMGFSVSHDALHGAYSSNSRVNAVLGYFFDLIGANSYMWKITHNVIHHTYTNITGIDEDLTVSPIVRLSPEAPRYPFHRFQHFFAFPAYSLATINWLFAKDFQQFLKKDIGPYKDKKHPPIEIFKLFVTKAVAISYQVILPLWLLDITLLQFVIGFLTMHMVAGLILGVIFQLAHVVEGPEYLAPDKNGDMESSWLIHEMRTTANFARNNHLLTWYVGGLNYQIEHHLFPQTCSIHYPNLSPIVREVAARHNVPYNYHPTLLTSIKSHLTMLRQLGRPIPAHE